MNPRTPIADLELSGSPNLKRAKKYRERDQEKRRSPETKLLLKDIDALINITLVECAKGSTVGAKEKANPAFKQLEQLVKTRKMLLKEDPPETKKSTEDLLAEADAFLGKEN
jgi:hypothetical protein